MNKKLITGIIVVALIIIMGGIFLSKKFVYNWNHDVIWEGERLANMRYFSGCALGSELMNGNDEFFSQEWNKLSTEYEFTASDIDALIPSCSSSVRDKDLLAAQERVSHPKRPLTEEEIEKEIKESLVNIRVADYGNGRNLTEVERLETEKYLRESLKLECWDLQDQIKLSRFDCINNVEQLKKDIASLDIYQKKFLNRGFSALKK